MSSEHAVEQVPLAEQRRDRSAFVQCRESITFRLPPREAKGFTHNTNSMPGRVRWPQADDLFVTVTLPPGVAQRERHCPASVYVHLMDKIDYPLIHANVEGARCPGLESSLAPPTRRRRCRCRGR